MFFVCSGFRVLLFSLHFSYIVTENKSEEAMERMREVADDLVAKLMEEEEGPIRDDMIHHHLPHHGAHVREPEKWLYRDPQGQVQGTYHAFLPEEKI